MDTYSIVFVIVTALSLAAAYSLGKPSKRSQEEERELHGVANS